MTILLLAQTSTAPATGAAADEMGFQHWAVVILVGGIAALVVLLFAVRYWLAVTRPANIQDVATPTMDRLNAAALDQLAAAHEGEAPGEVVKDEAAPADLLAAVPEEEKDKGAKR